MKQSNLTSNPNSSNQKNRSLGSFPGLFFATLFLLLSLSAQQTCSPSGLSPESLITSSNSTELFVYTTSEIIPVVLDIASVPVVIKTDSTLVLSSYESIQIVSNVIITSNSVVFEPNSQVNFVGSAGREEPTKANLMQINGSLEIQPGVVLSLNFFSEEQKQGEIPIIQADNISGVENIVLDNPEEWSIVASADQKTISVLFTPSSKKKTGFGKYLYIILPSTFGAVCLLSIFLVLILLLVKKGSVSGGKIRSWIFFAKDKESDEIISPMSSRAKKHGIVLGAGSSYGTAGHQKNYSVTIQPNRSSNDSSGSGSGSSPDGSF